MHRVPGRTSGGASSLPPYLAGAVVKRIYRSLLANVARKGGSPGGLIKNNVTRRWRSKRRQKYGDRIAEG